MEKNDVNNPSKNKGGFGNISYGNPSFREFNNFNSHRIPALKRCKQSCTKCIYCEIESSVDSKVFSEFNKLIPAINGEIKKIEEKLTEKIDEFINHLRMEFEFNIKEMYEKVEKDIK